MNTGAPWPTPKLASDRVLEIQRKLHKWASDDPNRRFDDLHNLVVDPATLIVAWQRVRSNRGSRSAGIDGQTARYVEQVLGVQKFLGDLREELRCGTFRPTAVKQRMIPKRGGKFRRLGVPTLRDRVVQAALKTGSVAPIAPMTTLELTRLVKRMRGSSPSQLPITATAGRELHEPIAVGV